MKRLEQIKRRYELFLQNPSEYGHLLNSPQADIEYLIELLEQSEAALECVANASARETMRRYAEQALIKLREK